MKKVLCNIMMGFVLLVGVQVVFPAQTEAVDVWACSDIAGKQYYVMTETVESTGSKIFYVDVKEVAQDDGGYTGTYTMLHHMSFEYLGGEWNYRDKIEGVRNSTARLRAMNNFSWSIFNVASQYR